MRIGHISPAKSNIPNGRGGPTRIFTYLNESLYKINQELTVFGHKNSKISGKLKYLYNEELVSNNDFLKAEAGEKELYIMLHMQYAYLNSTNIDIMQSHSIRSLPVGKMYPELPSVITLHGPINDQHIFMLKKFNSSNVHFVLVSNSRKSQLSKYVNNFSIILNGIDLNKIKPCYDKSDYFLYVGRIIPSKGLHLAIDVCLNLNKKLIIIGKPDNTYSDSEKYFENEIHKHLNNSLITYISEVSHEEIFKYYQNAIALFFPLLDPTEEGMPNVLAESLASGTPIIAFKNNFTTELLEDEKDSLLANTINDLVRCVKDIKKISNRQCRINAELKFSSTRMAHQYYNLYQHLLNK